MIDRHIRWAASHDWFVRKTSSKVGNGVLVREVSTRNGQTETRLRWFGSFPLLYQWAGY